MNVNRLGWILLAVSVAWTTPPAVAAPDVNLGNALAKKLGAKVVPAAAGDQPGYWQIGEDFQILLAPSEPAGRVQTRDGRVTVGLGLGSKPRVADIKRIAYTTRTGPLPAHVNVVLNIYTTADSDPNLGANDASWYQRCLTGEPLYAVNYVESFPDNQWNTFSTDHPKSPLPFFDSKHTPPGFTGAPTLAAIAAADLTKAWGDLTKEAGKKLPEDSYAYKDMTVEALALSSSHDSSWKNFKADLAELRLELADGQSVRVRFGGGEDVADVAEVAATSSSDVAILAGAGVGVLAVLAVLVFRLKRSRRSATGKRT
jgi:hypothetical protein